MDYLYLALYALLILAATIAGDKSRLLANELRWRLCKFWHCQVKPVLSVIEGWRLGRLK